MSPRPSPRIPLPVLKYVYSNASFFEQVHCFCTATAFLCTIAPCVQANCSAADQQNTQSIAQQICNSTTPPVPLPSFSSLLNGTICNGTTASGGSSSTAGASSTATVSSSATAKSGSGRIEGDMRVGMAVGAMICAAAIAFFAV